MKRTLFHRLARAELNAAVDWYEREREGLGLDFLEEVRRTIDRVDRNPLARERYKKTDMRFALVRRFPYVIFYTQIEDVLWIAAVAHGRRRPGYWRRRKPND